MFFCVLLIVSCQDQVEIPVSRGDDGQIFAIDTKESELPYLVIDTEGNPVQLPG